MSSQADTVITTEDPSPDNCERPKDVGAASQQDTAQKLVTTSPQIGALDILAAGARLQASRDVATADTDNERPGALPPEGTTAATTSVSRDDPTNKAAPDESLVPSTADRSPYDVCGDWYLDSFDRQMMSVIDPAPKLLSPYPSFSAVQGLSREKLRKMIGVLEYVSKRKHRKPRNKKIPTTGTKDDLCRRISTFFYRLVKQKTDSSVRVSTETDADDEQEQGELPTRNETAAIDEQEQEALLIRNETAAIDEQEQGALPTMNETAAISDSRNDPTTDTTQDDCGGPSTAEVSLYNTCGDWLLDCFDSRIASVIDPAPKLVSPYPSFSKLQRFPRHILRRMCKDLKFVAIRADGTQTTKKVPTTGTMDDTCRRISTFFYRLAKQKTDPSLTVRGLTETDTGDERERGALPVRNVTAATRGSRDPTTDTAPDDCLGPDETSLYDTHGSWFLYSFDSRIASLIDPAPKLVSPYPSFNALRRKNRETLRRMCDELKFVAVRADGKEKTKQVPTTGTKDDLCRRISTFFYLLVKQKTGSCSTVRLSTNSNLFSPNEDIRLLEVYVAEENRHTVNLLHQAATKRGPSAHAWEKLTDCYNDFIGFTPETRYPEGTELGIDPNGRSIRHRSPETIKNRWGKLCSSLSLVMRKYENSGLNDPNKFPCFVDAWAKNVRSAMLWMFETLVEQKHEIYNCLKPTLPEGMRLETDVSFATAVAGGGGSLAEEMGTTAEVDLYDSYSSLEDLMAGTTARLGNSNSNDKVMLLGQKRTCDATIRHLEDALDEVENRKKRLKRTLEQHKAVRARIVEDLAVAGLKI